MSKLDCDCGRAPGKHTSLDCGVPIPDYVKVVTPTELHETLKLAEEALMKLLGAINGVMPQYVYLRECEQVGLKALAAIREVQAYEA